MIESEGLPVYSLQNYRRLDGESFDLVYLYHATCETLLGLMFAGRVPIVRGYIGEVRLLPTPSPGASRAARRTSRRGCESRWSDPNNTASLAPWKPSRTGTWWSDNCSTRAVGRGRMSAEHSVNGWSGITPSPAGSGSSRSFSRTSSKGHLHRYQPRTGTWRCSTTS